DVPMVVVERFLSAEWCGEIAKRFDAEIARTGRHVIESVPGIVLKTLARTIELVDAFPRDYLAAVDDDAPRVRRLFDGGPDPLALVDAEIARAGWRRAPAVLDGAPCHPDLVWAMSPGSASPVHVDTFLIHHPCALSRYAKRIGYNAFVRPSEAG